MNRLEQDFLKKLPPEFSPQRPRVRFMDHAVLDNRLTEESGRPRFRAVVYIEKIATAANHTKDIFRRKMTDVDKMEWPEEWARYQELKTVVANRNPPLKAIPGMDVASYEELKALKLYDCKLLAEYTGELWNLAPLRETAKRIMEVSNECAIQDEKREALQVGAGRPVHADMGTGGQGRASIESHPRHVGESPRGVGEEDHTEKNNTEKGFQEKGFKETSIKESIKEGVMFSYNVQVN